jgi:hypothetical protein
LQKAVANQPVAVAIEAGGRSFQLYDSVKFQYRNINKIKILARSLKYLFKQHLVISSFDELTLAISWLLI